MPCVVVGLTHLVRVCVASHKALAVVKGSHSTFSHSLGHLCRCKRSRANHLDSGAVAHCRGRWRCPVASSCLQVARHLLGAGHHAAHG